MPYRISIIIMTFSDLQGQKRIASLCKWDGIFLYSCAAVDKISTDIAHGAVPLL